MLNFKKISSKKKSKVKKLKFCTSCNGRGYDIVVKDLHNDREANPILITLYPTCKKCKGSRFF